MARDKIVLHRYDYPDDVLKIQKAVILGGFECSRRQAEWLWLRYSNSMSAGWLILDSYSNEGIVEAVSKFIEDGGHINE